MEPFCNAQLKPEKVKERGRQKPKIMALTGVAQWVGCHPEKGKAPIRMRTRGNQSLFLFHIDVSLPVFPSPSPLCENKQIIFLKRQ